MRVLSYSLVLICSCVFKCQCRGYALCIHKHICPLIGQVMSTKKEELVSILDNFNIQVGSMLVFSITKMGPVGTWIPQNHTQPFLKLSASKDDLFYVQLQLQNRSVFLWWSLIFLFFCRWTILYQSSHRRWANTSCTLKERETSIRSGQIFVIYSCSSVTSTLQHI